MDTIAISVLSDPGATYELLEVRVEEERLIAATLRRGQSGKSICIRDYDIGYMGWRYLQTDGYKIHMTKALKISPLPYTPIHGGSIADEVGRAAFTFAKIGGGKLWFADAIRQQGLPASVSDEAPSFRA